MQADASCKSRLRLTADLHQLPSNTLPAVSNFDTSGREFEKARRQLTFVCNCKIQSFVNVFRLFTS